MTDFIRSPVTSEKMMTTGSHPGHRKLEVGRSQPRNTWKSLVAATVPTAPEVTYHHLAKLLPTC